MKRFARILAIFVAFYFVMGSLTGCGPYKKPVFVEIEPNETAFLVPLEGANKTNQAKFMSLDYLEQAKVAVKRVEIPLRKISTGRMWFSYKWIPTMRCIKVDRKPVTREWTASPEKGTSAVDDALPVETVESINFAVGMTVTASILEEDAAKFLYYFSGKSLAKVLDENVRGYVLAICADKFGKLSLDECRKQKSAVIAYAREKAKKYYKERGITIETMGNSGGLLYDPRIQQKIDEAFQAEQNIIVQKNNKLAQDQINAKRRTMADTKLYEARKFAAAQEATSRLIELEIARMNAEANLKFATGLAEGKVQLPANILPSESPFLFNLGTRK